MTALKALPAGGREVYLPEEAAEYLGVPLAFLTHLRKHGAIPVSAASLGRHYRFAENHLRAIDRGLIQAAYAAFRELGNSGRLEDIWTKRRGNGVMGLVYFISDGSAVKIGYAARSIKERMTLLQCGNLRPLELLAQLPGDVYLERALHRHFAHIKIRAEWFKPTPLLRRFITAAPAYDAAIRALTEAADKAFDG